MKSPRAAHVGYGNLNPNSLKSVEISKTAGLLRSDEIITC
jgi:hypothetical protein